MKYCTKQGLKKITSGVLAIGLITLQAHAQQSFDIEAHRGGMGLMPENTVASHLNGLKIGTRTLELDVVISKDGQVVVSHDAYMSSVFMRKPDGTDISKEEEKKLYLYQMNYDSIRRFDAGSKPHPGFPMQQKMKTYKPLLAEVIDSVETYVRQHHLKPVYYNIETKISPDGDGVFNPEPAVFVEKLMAVVKNKGITKRTIIQSFDVRTLQVLHQTNPKIRLSLLVFKGNVEDNIKALGFVPDIYSPYYTTVDETMVNTIHQQKMQLIPWTVDEEKDMKDLKALGVDGIITNYPDRLVKLAGSYQE